MNDFFTNPLPAHLDEGFEDRERNIKTLVEDSFVVLSDDRDSHRDVGGQINALERVFEIASDKTQIDHPLCETCSKAVRSELKANLEAAEKEGEELQSFLNTMTEDANPGHSDRSLEQKKVELSKEENELKQQLQRIRQERELVDEDIKALKVQENKLDGFYDRFWRDFQELEYKSITGQEEAYAVNAELEHNGRLLQRLRKTHALSDTFYISHDGHFGTINGFRLGKLDSRKVPTEEANAGLGQIVLLLDAIAKKVNYNWDKRYQLQPLGSFSKIMKCKNPNNAKREFLKRDLFENPTQGLMFRLNIYNGNEEARCWLLECVDALSEFAARQDPNLSSQFKHRIDVKSHTIGDLSIKNRAQSQQYTNALKRVLFRCKLLQLWCASLDASAPVTDRVSATSTYHRESSKTASNHKRRTAKTSSPHVSR